MEVRQLSEDEKRKMADNISVEVENVVDNNTPEDLVISQINDYHKNMLEQINNVNNMILVNNEIYKVVENLYDKCEDEGVKDIYKQELGSRKEIITQLTKSSIIMKQRASLTEKIKALVSCDLSLLKNIDFYFGNMLKIMTPEEINDIIEKNIV